MPITIAHAEAAAALKLATWLSTAYSVVLLVNLQLMLMLLLLLRRISREGYNEGGATRLIHCLLSISIIYIELIQFNSNQFLAHYYHHHHFIRSIDDRSSWKVASSHYKIRQSNMTNRPIQMLNHGRRIMLSVLVPLPFSYTTYIYHKV